MNINKLLLSALFLSTLFTGSISNIQIASAVPVTATGTAPSVCNQEVGNSTGVTAVRLSGGDCVIEFKSTAAPTTWTVPTGLSTVWVLVIAGGGGGGGDEGGGGGAGGYRENSTFSISGLNSIEVSVGAGGDGGNDNTTRGSNGENSYFASITSAGGGGGGTAANTDAVTRNGSAGGSGGGGAGERQNTSGGSGNTPATSPAQGFNGGNRTTTNDVGAGGGGAAEAGDADGSGNGGDGVASSITGTPVTRAGGGGGGLGNTTSNAITVAAEGGGGLGGGTNRIAGSGTANTGGGGGGGGSAGSNFNGAVGGSGIVIVRYTPDTTAPTYSSSSISSDGLNLTLTYSETLSATTAAPANFVVTVNSTETRTISSVSASGSSITLAFGSRIEAEQSIAVTYTDPTGGNDLNAIQDLAGNDASTLSNQSIINTLNSTNDSALTLNGSSQYAAATSDVSGFDIANAITLEAWIYPTGTSCSGNIVGKATSYFLYCVSGVLAYAMGGASSWSGVSTGITIPVNQWSHIAMTRGASASTASIYLNGNLVYSGTADGAGASALTNSNAPNLFNIGARNGSATFFTGRIDEVKLWNVARTQAQVQNDLKTYGGSFSDGLVAYYDFNDSSGTTLINRSTGGSSDLNLALYGSPTLTSAEIIDSSTFQAYTVVKFLRTFLVAGGGWTSPASPKRIQYLVVGGGGGGGNNVGDGGGGGGRYKVTNATLLSSARIGVTVGVGGSGGLSAFDGTSRMDGQAGESSTVTVNATTYTGSGGGGGQTYWGNNFCGGSTSPTRGSTAGGFSGSGGVGTNGGAGGTASSTQSIANGATGYIDSITGTAQFYGAGGGSGFWSGNAVAGIGANSIAGNGGNNNGVTGASGTNNTGSGGGGGGANCANGGAGGSGIVVLRYITNDPSITTQPTNDTTTVGTVDTFTITTTTLPTPLTKLVNWQVATDTTTATASVSWQNVTLGTGLNTDTYTTQTLTLSMNKYRYRAIVTFTDMDSLTVIETSTVVTLTVNPAITITSDTSTITRKYGDSQTVRTLVYSGGTTSTGAVGTTTTHTVRGSFGTQASGRIVLDTSTTTTVFRVDTGTVVGSYVETITVTDAKGATATYTQRVVVNPADTLTVQADTLTAMTYSPSGLVISPATTLTGLVSGDTKDSLTFTYSSKNVTCANGGTCAVGNTGPGGGIVFYSVSGKYLEAAPASWFGTATDTRTVWGCSGSTYSIAYATAIGTGKANTDQIVSNCGNPTSNVAAKIARAYTGGGKSDWSLPSRDELIELCKYARTQTTGNVSTSCTTAGTLNAGVLKGFGNADGDSQYWSSSDASTNNAYTVWLSGSVSGGFGGKTIDRYIRPVRYFTSDLYAANSCAAGGSCSLGDIGPSGGVVFYVSSSGSINSASNISEGGTYLEAAPSPFSATTYKWCEGSSNPYTTLLGASGTAIGTGAANTATALASCTGGAIYQAANLTSGGYSDWFLPSSNELSQMYAWRNSIGLSSSALYWGSTENANWIAASLVMSNGGIGSQNKGQATTYWPIRAFSQVLPTLQSYGPITTPPTNAGTYTVTPSNLTLIGGISTSNYTFINYLSSEFIINKARQDTLTVGSVLGVYETGTATMQITTLGGSDTGTVTYAVASGGTATGCSVSSNLLTVISVGTCRLVATKAATLNYLIAYSDTATITFTRFTPRAVQVQLYPSMIPLNQGNALETTTVTSSTLTISAVTRTGAGAYTITGTGFTNIELVSIGGAALTGSNYTRVSSTTLTLSGVSSFVGPLLIRLADGQESVLFQFDWS